MKFKWISIVLSTVKFSYKNIYNAMRQKEENKHEKCIHYKYIFHLKIALKIENEWDITFSISNDKIQSLAIWITNKAAAKCAADSGQRRWSKRMALKEKRHENSNVSFKLKMPEGKNINWFETKWNINIK